MWQEYAIEPGCFTRSLHDCHRILDGVGWESGRLVAEYPGNWRRLFWDGLLRHDDTHPDYKKLLERLAAFASPEVPARIAAGFISGRRSGVTQGTTWAERARAGHAREPFAGIITVEEMSAVAGCTCLDRLFDSNSVWRSPPSRTIARTNREVIGAARHLLRESSEIVLIDGFLDPSDHIHQATIGEMFDAMSPDAPSKRIRLHTCKAADLRRDIFEYNVRRNLAVRTGETFDCVVWHAAKSTERFHDRFLISNLGGLGIQGGLDSANQSQHTSAYRLGNEDREFWLSRFEGLNPAFAEICRFTIC